MRPIVIAAGGTGGHFFPAEALTTALIARGHRVILMTDVRTGSRLGPVFSGVEHHVISGSGVAGRGAVKSAAAVASLVAGVVQARRILGRLDAAAVVGFGGYPGLPPVLAASVLRRRPVIVLHEQNAVLGRANRLCARRADLLVLGFAQTARVPTGLPTVALGNPVRPAFQALAGRVYAPPDHRIELLVAGGSLGARIFSDVVPDALELLPADLRSRLHVVQQCRAEDLPRVADAYRSAGVRAELAAFFPDFAERLAAAHLVISRAGASTCAELAVVGRPSIVVPLPSAIDDHQAANAAALDGAAVLAQRDLTPARLASEIGSLLVDPERLATAAARTAAGGRPGSAQDLADAVERVVARANVSP